MLRFQTLMEGRLQFKIGVEDRLLLDELGLQARERRQTRGSGQPAAAVLILLIRKWCRKPRRFAPIRTDGKSVRIDLRLRFPNDKLCQQFAGVLESRGEKNASSVLRALVHDHIQPQRNKLKANASRREAEAREREARKQKAAKQQKYRDARRNSVADAIEAFLPELGQRYTERAWERVHRDSAALVKLGLRVAHYLAAVKRAKERRDPEGARQDSHHFADQVARILGFALVQPSAMIPTTAMVDRKTHQKPGTTR